MTGTAASRRRTRRESALAWALLLPALLFLGVFVIYPALDSLYLSFHDVSGFTGSLRWVGFANYRDLALSIEYRRSIGVSIEFMLLTVIPAVLLSLGVALALDANPYFRDLLRGLFLLPVAISSAMAAMLWVFIYNPGSGYLNFLLGLAHIGGPDWLSDPRWSLPAVAIATVWKETGFNVIFFLAGLSSVSPDLRESAALDGANAWGRFRHVTLPALSPTLLFVTVVSVIQSFESFGQIHILTAGGPAGSTTTLVYRLYRDAFENFETGSASAQAVVLFALMLCVTLAQFSLARRRLHNR